MAHLLTSLLCKCPCSCRDGRFGYKVGQIGTKWDKSGSFSDQISEHLARERQMLWNLIRKGPGFVPFGANLTHFGAKPTIPNTTAGGKSWLSQRGGYGDTEKRIYNLTFTFTPNWDRDLFCPSISSIILIQYKEAFILFLHLISWFKVILSSLIRIYYTTYQVTSERFEVYFTWVW